MEYEERIDYFPKAPLERTLYLYTVLIMWLAWQQAGGDWEPTIFSTAHALGSIGHKAESSLFEH